MNAVEDAVALCARNGCDFWAEWKGFALRGWAIVTPQCVLLAEPAGPGVIFLWLVVGEGWLPALCNLAPVGTHTLQWARSFTIDRPPEVRQFPFRRVRALASTLNRHNPWADEEENSNRLRPRPLQSHP